MAYLPRTKPVRCHLILFVLSMSAAMTSNAQPGESVVEAEKRIEKKFGHPFADIVRLRLWSLYGTSNRFARELGIARGQLDKLLKVHEWDLMHPPALIFQNKDIPQVAVRASADDVHKVEGLVDEKGRPAKPNTWAEIACDRYTITVSLVCDEPDLKGMTANTPARDTLTPKERAYWEGDFVPLKKALFKGQSISKMKEWVEQLSPPETSALLDDCVIIFLTPAAIGKDHSYLTLAQLAPDPDKMLAELRPLKGNRVFLEGMFYLIAVNPNGAVLDVFYDPWDGGTFCPAWHSMTKVSTKVSRDGWKAKVEIPLRSLKPNVNEDSIWGVDLSRIRRTGSTSAQMTRSKETTFIEYDIPVRPGAPPAPGPVPEVSVGSLPHPIADGAFPTAEEWSKSTLIKELYSNSLRKSERTQVRILHDERHLFVRFDCQEKDISRLKGVTREQEEKEYGKGNRRCNYLDRREAWGLDWGDYVEVLLAPDWDSTDLFHAGLFQFVINSRGDVLERYYDTFGMFTVSPHPPWKSGANVRVTKKGNTWSVELAIPFSVLCTSGKAAKRWGLNLHRCVSAKSGMVRNDTQLWLWGTDPHKKRTSPNVSRGREVHLCWSPTGKMIRNVRRLGIMEIDSIKVKVEASPNRPGPAPGRPSGPKQKPVKRKRESDRLASVCFVDRENGWAVGGRGTILYTSDGGATWEEQTSGTDFILEKVLFLDRNRGWAVGGWPRDPALAIYGGMGVILATDDGGKSWRPQLEAEAAWLSDICFIDPSNGWAVGEYGTVMRTKDGGATWTQMRNVPTPAWLFGVHFLDDRHGWAVGHYETVLKTEDGGESWAPQQAPTPYRPFGLSIAYRAVRFANEKEGWIVGDHGNILHTKDGGKTWATESTGLSDGVRDLLNFSDLTITKNGAAWAVSPVAVVARGAGGWRQVKTGILAWLRGVSFADDNNGWITGDRNTVIRTTDGGKTWKRQRDSGRRMGLLYGTPHDHHINGSAMGMLNEEFDTAYALFGRDLRRPFEFGGDVNSPKNDAATMALGVPVTYNFNEFSWRERDNPHRIAERYQHHGGIEPMEKRLVAMIRTFRPEILVGEQPVVQEGYYAHGVGQVARAVVAAFDSAGDPKRFPELLELGLAPFAPKKLYLVSIWPNELYDIHPQTLRLPPVHKFSERLGMTYGEASLMSRLLFWGLLDRGKPPSEYKPWPGSWKLHLKRSRVQLPDPEKNIFDGVR